MEFLQTERLVLRNWKPADLDELFDYRNEERCTRFQRGQMRQRQELEALIQRRMHDDFLPEGRKQLAIAQKDTDRLIGEVVIFHVDETITMGYTISYKHHRRGYAYEILSQVIQMLHGHYPQKEFIFLVDRENGASIGLLKKLGFKELACRDKEKETEEADGEDNVVYLKKERLLELGYQDGDKAYGKWLREEE